MGGKRRNCKRPRSKSTNRSSSRRRRSSIVERDPQETGYTVDTADLLFKPGRDYLVKNNGHKVRVDELKDKSIVLFIFPLGAAFTERGEALDMIDAYNELLPLGGVEFVFVPVHAPPSLYPCDDDDGDYSEEGLFRRLFYSMPFPAVPLSDAEAWDGPLMKTFGLGMSTWRFLPYWVVIDPSHTVVFTRSLHPDLFKLFGGAQLYPLSHEGIWSVVEQRWALSKQERINQWDQLLASPDRDYLLSGNGDDKVPISSLKGKVIGLYFCDNVPCPPSLHCIERVYEEAKLQGLDFEIVQINLPWPSFRKRYPSPNPAPVQRPEGIRWLTLPFKDPSCRKLLGIFPSDVFDDEDATWGGDGLVIIDARQATAAGADVPCEFSGEKILRRWGVNGYPFTRPSLFHIEYEIQKRKVTLQALFPPGECLRQPSGELVDASKLLSGKKVLVFFNDHTQGKLREGKFVTMLLSHYRAQRDVAEEDKFEVVYVSTHFPEEEETASESESELSYQDFMRPMPWLAHPCPRGSHYSRKVFKAPYWDVPAAAAFGSQGELIAKAHSLDQTRVQSRSRFPFISTHLESFIQGEVEDSGLLGLE